MTIGLSPPRISYRACIVALLLALASCTPSPPPAKPHFAHRSHAPSTTVEIDEVDESSPPIIDFPIITPASALSFLSLAEVGYEQNTPDAADYLHQVQTYAEHNTNAVTQPVVLLSFKVKKSTGIQYVMAPLTLPWPGTSFPELGHILSALGRHRYQLQDVQVGEVSFALPAGFAATGAGASAVGEAVISVQGSFHPLPALKGIEAQLQLTRFFITQHHRDGAYLSFENAKVGLAAQEEKNSDNLKVIALAHQLEEVEDDLAAAWPP